jgi:glucose uptake protein GlcU
MPEGYVGICVLAYSTLGNILFIVFFRFLMRSKCSQILSACVDIILEKKTIENQGMMTEQQNKSN